MKFRLPSGQVLIPLAVLSLVVASFGATLPSLDPSAAGLSTLPPCTTLGDLGGVSGSAAAQAGADLTSSTVVGPPGDDPTTSTDPDDTTTTSDPDDTTSTTTSDPPEDTTTTSDPPEDTTTTSGCSPGTTNGDVSTTSIGGTSTTGKGGSRSPRVVFLNRDKKAEVQTLQVGKFEKAFKFPKPPNKPELFSTFVDLDLAHFHVRVIHDAANQDKTKKEKVQVTLRTDSEDNRYDDGPVTLDLTEIGEDKGEFDSNYLLLVSNSADDLQETDATVADNARNDRSFRVMLNAKVIADYTTNSGTTSGRANVTPGLDIKLHITALAGADNTRAFAGEPYLDKPVDGKFNAEWNKGEDYLDLDQNGEQTKFLTRALLEQRILEEVRYSNEVLAQVGIRLVATKPLVTYRLADGKLDKGEFLVSGGGTRTDEEKALHDKNWYSASENDVEVFYVQRVRLRNAAGEPDETTSLAGFAFPATPYPNLGQFNDSLVISNGAPTFTLAHEVYHIVAQAPFHLPDPSVNLMKVPPQQIPLREKDFKVTDSRRLTVDQRTNVLKKYLS